MKEGNAPSKAKDVRQKTYRMRDIGLIDDNRILSQVGKKLLEIAKSGNFTSDIFLQIPKQVAQIRHSGQAAVRFKTIVRRTGHWHANLSSNSQKS